MAKVNIHKSIVGKAAMLCFLVTSAAMYFTIVSTRVSDTTRFIERRYLDMQTVIKAAIDPRFQNKADEISRVAERLVVIDAIKGGALFDGSGHLQETFGEPTETSFQAIQQTGRTIFLQDVPDRLEFYFSPETTATPFHILIRTESGEITSLEAIGDARTVLLSLISGGAAALAVAGIFLATVAIPLRRINRVMDRTLADPAVADHGTPLHTSGSEVGQMALSVERLRSTLADLWRTKVVVSEAILTNSPFAILQMSADGSPIYANPACAELFGRDVVHTFGTAPMVVKDLDTQERQNLKVFIDSHKGSPKLVEVPTSQRSRFALMASLTIGEDTRMPTTIVLAADVGEIHTARIKAESDLSLSIDRFKTVTRREYELKLMLEACIALLGGTKVPDEHMNIVPFAHEWLQASQEAGLVNAIECTEDAPMTAGGKDDLRAVIRLAALATYARLGSAPVDMSIDIRGINFETVGLVVSARPAEGLKSGPTAADSNLALAALRTAARRVGAQLGELSVVDEVASFKITLRGAAERLQTGMKGGTRAS